MRKLTESKSLIVVLSLLFIFSNCKKDDENGNGTGKSNSFDYAGNQYVTNSAQAINYGVGNSGACYFVVAISSNELSYDMTEKWFSGVTEHCIYIELYSQSNQEISPGIYTDSDSYNAYTFESDECHLMLDYNFDDDNGIAIEASDGGTLNISKTNGQYTFDYAFTFDGKSVTGYYSGNVQIIDMSSKKQY